jgi:hypothetical protein
LSFAIICETETIANTFYLVPCLDVRLFHFSRGTTAPVEADSVQDIIMSPTINIVDHVDEMFVCSSSTALAMIIFIIQHALSYRRSVRTTHHSSANEQNA